LRRVDVTIEEAERLIYLEGELLDDWRSMTGSSFTATT